MQFSIAALAGLVISTAASPIVLEPLESTLEPRVACVSGVRLIVASGHGAPVHGGYGLLNTTTVDIRNAIPGTTNISVPYPKNSLDYASAVAVAAQHVTNHVQSYAAACPDTPIVLFGYSEGAIGIMNAICGRSHIGSPYGAPLINSSYTKNIAAIVVYGDETRIPNQPYDLGTCKTGEGVDPRGNPKGCAPFESVMQSYCDKADPECCGGKNKSQHYVYPMKYNDVATQFIVDQYDNFQPS